MKNARYLLLLAALPIAFLAVTQFTERRETAGLALDGITAGRMRAHTAFLADDLLEGRAPSTRGGALAAHYIAAQFALLGLEPAGDAGTYYQQVPVVEAVVARDGVRLTAAGRTGRTTFAFADDLVVLATREDAEVSVDAPAVFVGYGIVAPEYDWNDYAGVDVRGAVVVALVNEPAATEAEPHLFEGDALTYYGRWTYKYEEALRQGAAGVVLVHTDASATYPFSVVRGTAVGTQVLLPPAPGASTLALKSWMTEAAAARLLALGGHDLDALTTAARLRGTAAVPLSVHVTFSMRQHTARRTTPNVVGRLAGRLDTQAVVFSAHYDHMGRQDTPDGVDGIFNGARDNATGVAALLEVARAFATAAEPPGRTAYFVATTAEERGLLGAEHFVAHAPLPVSQIAANLNLDSLNVYGPTSSVVLLGAERSTLGTLVQQLARQAERHVDVDPRPERGAFFRSDHFPFARAGVPAVSLSMADTFVGPQAGEAARRARAYTDTGYHQASDEVRDDWDWTGAVADARLIAELGWLVAASPRLPAYRRGDPFAAPRAQASR